MRNCISPKTFVIWYRVDSEQWASDDLESEITYIVYNSETPGVGSKDYTVWGGSVGARMAVNIACELFGVRLTESKRYNRINSS